MQIIYIKDLQLICRNYKSPLAYTGGSDKSIPNAGKLIGVVERLLAFVLILAGQYTALGFIIAAKSILRFSATEKNEYVLVGTLLSFGIAIATALVVAGLSLWTLKKQQSMVVWGERYLTIKLYQSERICNYECSEDDKCPYIQPFLKPHLLREPQ